MRSLLSKTKAAFSLIELLIVLLLIGILTLWVYPEFSKARVKSKAEAETQNLRIIEDAKAKFIKANPGHVPTSTNDIAQYIKGGQLPTSPWGVAYNNVTDLTKVTTSPVNGDPNKEPATTDPLTSNGYNDLGLEQKIYLQVPKPQLAYFNPQENPTDPKVGQQFTIYERNHWLDIGTGYNPANSPAPDSQLLTGSTEWYAFTQDDRLLSYTTNDPWWGGRKVGTEIVDSLGTIPVPSGQEFAGTISVRADETWISHNFERSNHTLTVTHSVNPASIPNGPPYGAVSVATTLAGTTNFTSSTEGTFSAYQPSTGATNGWSQVFKFGEKPTFSGYVNKGWHFLGFYATSGDGRKIAGNDYTTTTFDFNKIGSDPSLPSGPGQMTGTGPYGQTWNGTWEANNVQRTMDHSVEARWEAVAYNLLITLQGSGGSDASNSLQSITITGSSYPGMSSINGLSGTFYWGDKATITIVPHGGSTADQTANNVWGVVNWSGDFPTGVTSPEGNPTDTLTTGHRVWDLANLEVSQNKWPNSTTRNLTLNMEKYLRVRETIVNLTDPATNPVSAWYAGMNGRSQYLETWVSPRANTDSDSQWFNASNGRYNGVGHNPFTYTAPPNPNTGGQYAIYSINYPTGQGNISNDGLTDTQLLNPSTIPAPSITLASDGEAFFNYRKYGIITINAVIDNYSPTTDELQNLNVLAYTRTATANAGIPYVSFLDNPNYAVWWVGDSIPLSAKSSSYLFDFDHWEKKSTGEAFTTPIMSPSVAGNETWIAHFVANRRRTVTFQVQPSTAIATGDPLSTGSMTLTHEDAQTLTSNGSNALSVNMGVNSPFVATVRPAVIDTTATGEPQGTKWVVDYWDVSNDVKTKSGTAAGTIRVPSATLPELGTPSNFVYSSNLPDFVTNGNYTITAHLKKVVPDLKQPKGAAADKIQLTTTGTFSPDFAGNGSFTSNSFGSPGDPTGLPTSSYTNWGTTSAPVIVTSWLTIQGGEGYDPVPTNANYISKLSVAGFSDTGASPTSITSTDNTYFQTGSSNRSVTLNGATPYSVDTQWKTNPPNWTNPDGALYTTSTFDSTTINGQDPQDNNVALALYFRGGSLSSEDISRSVLLSVIGNGTFGSAKTNNPNAAMGFYNDWKDGTPGQVANSSNQDQIVPIRIKLANGLTFTKWPTDSGNDTNIPATQAVEATQGNIIDVYYKDSDTWEGAVRLSGGRFLGAFYIDGSTDNGTVTASISYYERRNVTGLTNSNLRDTVELPSNTQGRMRILQWSTDHYTTNNDVDFDADASDNATTITISQANSNYKPRINVLFDKSAPFWLGETINPIIQGINTPTSADKAALGMKTGRFKLTLNSVTGTLDYSPSGLIRAGERLTHNLTDLYNNSSYQTTGGFLPAYNIPGTTDTTISLTGTFQVYNNDYWSNGIGNHSTTSPTLTTQAYAPSGHIFPQLTINGETSYNTVAGQTAPTPDTTVNVPNNAVVDVNISAYTDITREIPSGMGLQLTLPAGTTLLGSPANYGLTIASGGNAQSGPFQILSSGSSSTLAKTIQVVVTTNGTFTLQTLAASRIGTANSIQKSTTENVAVSTKNYGDFLVKSLTGQEISPGVVAWKAVIARSPDVSNLINYTIPVTGKTYKRTELLDPDKTNSPSTRSYDKNFPTGTYSTNITIPADNTVAITSPNSLTFTSPIGTYNTGNGEVTLLYTANTPNAYPYPTVEGIFTIDPNESFDDNNIWDNSQTTEVNVTTNKPDTSISLKDVPPYLTTAEHQPIVLNFTNETPNLTNSGSGTYYVYTRNASIKDSPWVQITQGTAPANLSGTPTAQATGIEYPTNYSVVQVRAVYVPQPSITDANDNNNIATAYIQIGNTAQKPTEIPGERGSLWKPSEILTTTTFQPAAYDPLYNDPNHEDKGFDRKRYKQVKITTTETLSASGNKTFNNNITNYNASQSAYAKGMTAFSGSVTRTSTNNYNIDSGTNTTGSVIGTLNLPTENNRSFSLYSSVNDTLLVTNPNSSATNEASLQTRSINLIGNTFYIYEFPANQATNTDPNGNLYNYTQSAGTNFDLLGYINSTWSDWFGNAAKQTSTNTSTSDTTVVTTTTAQSDVTAETDLDQNGDARTGSGSYLYQKIVKNEYSVGVTASNLINDYLDITNHRVAGQQLPAKVENIDNQGIESSFTISKSGGTLTSKTAEGYINVYAPWKIGQSVSATYNIITSAQGYNTGGTQSLQAPDSTNSYTTSATVGADGWAHIPVAGLTILTQGIPKFTYTPPAKPAGWPSWWPWPLFTDGTTTSSVDSDGYPQFTTAPHPLSNNGVSGWGWGSIHVSSAQSAGKYAAKSTWPSLPGWQTANLDGNIWYQNTSSGWQIEGISYAWNQYWPSYATSDPSAIPLVRPTSVGYSFPYFNGYYLSDYVNYSPTSWPSSTITFLQRRMGFSQYSSGGTIYTTVLPSQAYDTRAPGWDGSSGKPDYNYTTFSLIDPAPYKPPTDVAPILHGPPDTSGSDALWTTTQGKPSINAGNGNQITEWAGIQIRKYVDLPSVTISGL
jgi:prepilin-type N-terminal cleavage/methylation domain-containing protein